MAKKWYEVDMNNSKNQGFYNKQMKEDLKNFYLTGVTVTPTEPEPEPEDTHFTDDFESNWFESNAYALQLNDNFESNWFTDNNFIYEHDDEFELAWFIYNNFINQDSEDFEGEDWNE